MREYPSKWKNRLFAPCLLMGVALAGCAEPPADDPALDDPEAAAEAAAEAEPILVEGVGFATPESVLHDRQADVYLVSNINGDPLGKADNGFISRLSPDGEVLELRWIDGAEEGVTLHAPKGMAVVGGLLYVSDIDVVRVFDRSTGEPVDEFPVEGASFLNDLAAGPDGTIYVSDTGMGPGFEPSGTDAVYALRNGDWVALATGEALLHPNGLAVADGSLIMVPFGGASIFRIPLDGGEPSVRTELPAGQLDGVIRRADGSLLVSSWEGQAVYLVGPDGRIDVAVDGVEAPADIGWDAERGRLLVPLFMDDAVLIQPLDG
jgi:hypothetical protein